jgi:hypothetical protein
MAAVGLVKGDDALAANGREDGLIRPDRAKVLGKFFGVCGNSNSSQDDHARQSGS